jgi:hypothetical protein
MRDLFLFIPSECECSHRGKTSGKAGNVLRFIAPRAVGLFDCGHDFRRVRPRRGYGRSTHLCQEKSRRRPSHRVRNLQRDVVYHQHPSLVEMHVTSI